jgi:hypothetical protein
MANPQCKIEQQTKAILPCGIVFDLSANVADDAAKSGAQEFEFPPRALELVGMRIASHHNDRAFGHAQVTLAQLYALAFGRLDSIARWVSGASVGCAIAFSCTVVSTTMRSRPMRH